MYKSHPALDYNCQNEKAFEIMHNASSIGINYSSALLSHPLFKCFVRVQEEKSNLLHSHSTERFGIAYATQNSPQYALSSPIPPNDSFYSYHAFLRFTDDAARCCSGVYGCGMQFRRAPQLWRSAILVGGDLLFEYRRVAPLNG
ncbi:hypothetical protein QE152_g34367 [Popillia japonica]|uniref:Uncharacterized protein n=1 Tax=Popillia japonica TaxID=7064 RepID=A0AAW1IT87_POPJA